jgi:DNA-3-methyladenine glycosylase
LIKEKEKYNLTSGPGKICQALSITKDHYGIDLTGNKIFLLDQPILNDGQIVFSKRIGIKKSVDLPWRLYIKDNPYISRK